MSNIIKVLEIFSNSKNVNDPFCAVKQPENHYKNHNFHRTCIFTELHCDECAFSLNNQKTVSTIVKENSIHE